MITDLIVIQPTNFCNLNCSYCYLPDRKNKKLMSYEILEKTIDIIFSSNVTKPIKKEDYLTIVFHSGEPLFAGLDWYKRCINLIKKYNTDDIKLKLEIQTNATLLNQEWCNFFKKNNIDVSLSLDGPDFIHNKYRLNYNNKGSFGRVMKGVELCKKNNISLQAICVLTENSLKYPKEIYSFFKDNNFKTLGLNIDEIECINEKSSLDIESKKYIIDLYYSFMSTFYDLWVKDDKLIKIREFCSFLRQIKIKKIFPDYYLHNLECLPFGIISVSKDGNISTFSPELSGGVKNDPNKFFIDNVMNINSFNELVETEKFKNLFFKIKNGTKNCAHKCKYFDLCGGGSPSNKFYETGSFESTETKFCILTKQVMTDLLLNKLSKSSLT